MTTNPTPTPAGAQAGSERASGAVLSKRARFENQLRWHFNVVAEEGKGSAYISIGIANALRDMEAILRETAERAWNACLRAADAVLASDWLATHVREQVDAALGEVEQRIEAEKWAHRRATGASTGHPVCRAYDDASQIVRDYRKVRTDA